MGEKTAVQRMHDYNSKCTVMGIKIFEFEYFEEEDEVFITRIYISDNETERTVRIPSFVSWVDYSAWHDNSQLKNCLIYIPKGCRIMFHSEDTTALRYFGHCAKEIFVEEDHEDYSSENGVLFNKEKTVLLAYPAGRTEENYTIPDSVIKIENGAFFEHKYLRTLHISQDVIEIKNCQFWGFTRIEVDTENTMYRSINSSLYSKDGKIAYHLFAHRSGNVKIEEGTVLVKEMYLTGDFDELYLPESLKPMDGLKALLEDIRGGYEQIVAPKSLKDYLGAFEGVYEIIYY